MSEHACASDNGSTASSSSDCSGATGEAIAGRQAPGAMCPAPLGNPSDAAIGRYATLLKDWDQAIYLGDLKGATAKRTELAEFLGGLETGARHALEAEIVVIPGWTPARRVRLQERWDALQLHGGSWQHWCDQLHRSQSSPASSSQPPREALLRSACDLVWLQAPEAQHRAELWSYCADAPSEAAALPSQIDEDKEESDVSEIWLDVQRTPHLAEGQDASLVKILAAYCARSVGGSSLTKHYVQGMHMLAACPLWAGLSEAEALAVFEFVLRTLCVDYYADDQFTSFQRDVCVADALISERLPKLSAALQEAGVSTMLLAFEPLLCLFTRNMPCKTVLRLWDVMLLEGDAAVFALLLALLERLLPEVSQPLQNSIGGARSWDTFPFADVLQERAANMDLEELLVRARAHLNPPESASLRERLEELRHIASHEPSDTGSVDERGRTSKDRHQLWLDHVLKNARDWWEGPPSASPARVVIPESPTKSRSQPGDAGRALRKKLSEPRGAPTVDCVRVRERRPHEYQTFSTFPVEVTMTLAEDYIPGSSIFIKGPHGQMEVQPPPGAGPGAHVRYKIAPSPDYAIRVPRGAQPGQEVKFYREDGVQATATVPDGCQPGEVFGVTPPAVMVLVPDGATARDAVVFRIPGTNELCRARIPEGTRAGKYFAVRLPPPQRPELDSAGAWLQAWLGFPVTGI